MSNKNNKVKIDDKKNEIQIAVTRISVHPVFVSYLAGREFLSLVSDRYVQLHCLGLWVPKTKLSKSCLIAGGGFFERLEDLVFVFVLLSVAVCCEFWLLLAGSLRIGLKLG